jgi:hypothetical protein
MVRGVTATGETYLASAWDVKHLEGVCCKRHVCLGAGSASGAQRRDDLPESAPVQDRALAAYPGRVDTQDPVDPGSTGSAAVVPGASTDISPPTLGAGVGSGVAVVALAGQRKGQKPGSVAADHQDGAVFALMVVLFKRHPGPDNLAGVGYLAVGGVGTVADLGGSPEVCRVGSSGRGTAGDPTSSEDASDDL